MGERGSGAARNDESNWKSESRPLCERIPTGRSEYGDGNHTAKYGNKQLKINFIAIYGYYFIKIEPQDRAEAASTPRSAGILPADEAHCILQK